MVDAIRVVDATVLERTLKFSVGSRLSIQRRPVVISNSRPSSALVDSLTRPSLCPTRPFSSSTLTTCCPRTHFQPDLFWQPVNLPLLDVLLPCTCETILGPGDCLFFSPSSSWALLWLGTACCWSTSMVNRPTLSLFYSSNTYTLRCIADFSIASPSPRATSTRLTPSSVTEYPFICRHP